MPNYVHLTNRELILISGIDHLTFLQGLITNDVFKAAENLGIYSLMLNPQGRFLHEFFITKYQDGLVLETDKNYSDSLIKKLSFYKLRSKVEIKKLNEFQVFFLDDETSQIPAEIKFKDPRKSAFGLRFYEKSENIENLAHNLKAESLNFYHNLRQQNKIIDENDLTFDQSIIVEYGFDDLNAIDYKKGCYVGQELVARAHYKGQLRKRIFLVEIENSNEISKGSEITCDGRKQGVILSSLFYQGKLSALALIKNVDNTDNEIDLRSLQLRVNDQKIIILK